MRKRGVRVVMAALIVSIPPLIVAVSEPGVGQASGWGSGQAWSLVLAEASVLAGMLLAGWARSRLLGRARPARPARTPSTEVAAATAGVPTLSAS